MSGMDFALSLLGVPQDTIRELDAKLPALERVAVALKEIEPTLTKIWPDVVAVSPLVIALIAFAKQKEAQ